jgi:hypothetical protein
LSVQAPVSTEQSAGVRKTANTDVKPQDEAPSNLNIHFFNFFRAYSAPRTPAFPMSSPSPIDGLVRDGKLYLSLRDAIVLAIQNNLDVEVSRYNLLLADTDLTRAQAHYRNDGQQFGDQRLRHRSFPGNPDGKQRPAKLIGKWQFHLFFGAAHSVL